MEVVEENGIKQKYMDVVEESSWKYTEVAEINRKCMELDGSPGNKFNEWK